MGTADWCYYWSGNLLSCIGDVMKVKYRLKTSSTDNYVLIGTEAFSTPFFVGWVGSDEATSWDTEEEMLSVLAMTLKSYDGMIVEKFISA